MGVLRRRAFTDANRFKEKSVQAGVARDTNAHTLLGLAINFATSERAFGEWQQLARVRYHNVVLAGEAGMLSSLVISDARIREPRRREVSGTE